jgi:hypothetical protein
MVRTCTAFVLALTVVAPVVHADERHSSDPVAPTAAVAAAWKQEAKPSSASLRALFVSYSAVQALDMTSTIKARNNGAIEANPVMQGSYAKGMAVKAALGAATMVAVRSLEKKNKKAAIITMIAANLATAAVVAHNMQVAAHAGR